MNCLLIETKDKRKFLTHEKNFTLLIEFSKTFNAEISTVNLETGTMLELEELAPAICNPLYKKPKFKYEIIEQKVKTKNRKRKDILIVAEKIKEYILEKFKNEKFILLKDLKIKFKEYKLTDATLCNHIRRIKKELEEKGIKLKKTGAGKYSI